MANVIANNMDRFRQDFRYLEHKISSLQELHRKVFEEINALTGMWEGAAHDIYLAQFQKEFRVVFNYNEGTQMPTIKKNHLTLLYENL